MLAGRLGDDPHADSPLFGAERELVGTREPLRHAEDLGADSEGMIWKSNRCQRGHGGGLRARWMSGRLEGSLGYEHR
jgi:hypothetical protein